MNEKLKPCPFCGGEATVYEPFSTGFWFVCCSNGDTCRTCGPDRKTKAEAITAWNTRAERTCHVVRSPSYTNLHKNPWENEDCSECGYRLDWDREIPNIHIVYCPYCGAKVVE